MEQTRYLFFDIDGTLTDNSEPPSVQTVCAMEQLKQNGHKIFLCTGRTICDIYPAVKQPGYTGIIAGAGAHIFIGNSELHCSVLPTALVRQTAELFQKHNVSAVFESADQMWRLEGDVPLPWPQLPIISTINDIDDSMRIQKFTFRPNGAQRYNLLKPHLSSYHLYPNSTMQFAEAVYKGQTKATAMKRVLNHFNATTKQALAFGDSLNDMDILQCAGIGVAMGNAPEKVKQIASHTTGTCAQNGVYAALRYLELIK